MANQGNKTARVLITKKRSGAEQSRKNAASNSTQAKKSVSVVVKKPLVLVVGAGIAGLTAVRAWARRGRQVIIFEASPHIGGLASVEKITVAGESFYIERFYHHFFSKDKNLKRLLAELNLSKSLVFRKVKNRFSRTLVHPLDFLLFAGLTALPFWKLVKSLALRDVYRFFPRQLTHPSGFRLMMYKKFGEAYKDVSLSWLWARIHARFSLKDIIFGETLGVIEPSFKVVLDALVKRLSSLGVKILLKTPVSSVDKLIESHFPERIIITTPLHVAKSMFREFKWQTPEYRGAFNVVLFTQRPISEYYWDQSIGGGKENSYLVIVNQSLLNRSLPVHVAYIGGYVSSDHWVFRSSDKQVVDRVVSELGIEDDFIGYRVFKTRFAQHIPTVSYLSNMPPRNFVYRGVPVDLLSFGNLVPWDRGVNYSIILS